VAARTLKIFLEPYCAWWGSMRRLKRNHQKQPTIDWLGPAPGAAPRLPAQGSSGGVACHRGSGSHLLTQRSSGAVVYHRSSGSHLAAQRSSGAAQGGSDGAAALVPTPRLRTAPGSARVTWVPAPTSQRRTTPRASCVTIALGRMKTVEPSSSENRDPDDIF
jgi:hypothetical protein